jgi:cytochrome c oxidase subunit 2
MVLGVVDTRKVFEDLASHYLSIALAVFAIVVLACAYLLVRYRDRDRGGGARSPGGRGGEREPEDEPPWVPVVYAGVLAGVVALLVLLTFNAEDKIAAGDLRPGLEVRVTAAKWTWRFDYPALGISQVAGRSGPPVLVVPSATAIRFRLTSLDVIHSFWIPYLRFKRDAFPGRTSGFDLSFDRAGLHTRGLCAEFCGLQHDEMVFDVQVMAPAAFQAWAAARRPAATGAAR